jgi:hypothetical protein
LLAVAAPAFSAGRVGIHGLYMSPTGQDANEYSREGWGAGFYAILPLPQVHDVLAGVVGVDIVNLLSDTVEFQDPATGLRVEQQTDQTYNRVYIGPRIGPHRSGFLQPHVGANVALVFYNIHTDVVVPDDTNREQEIRQNLRSQTKTAFGYDVNLGAALQHRGWSFDTGARFLKTVGVPQQLGAGSTKIYPGYFQLYFGVGVGFEVFHREG